LFDFGPQFRLSRHALFDFGPQLRLSRDTQFDLGPEFRFGRGGGSDKVFEEALQWRLQTVEADKLRNEFVDFVVHFAISLAITNKAVEGAYERVMRLVVVRLVVP